MREIRNKETNKVILAEIWKNLSQNHKDDWLLSLELLELSMEINDNSDFEKEITNHLKKLQISEPALKEVISNGISVIKNKN